LVLAQRKSGDRERTSKNVIFLCRKRPGDLINFIREKGYEVIELPETTIDDFTIGGSIEEEVEVIASLSQRHADRDNDLPDLVIDHYGIGWEYERAVRPFVNQIMVIDDLENRPHDCDILLDQNYSSKRYRYKELVPSHCEILLGPQHALLRPEFKETRHRLSSLKESKRFDPEQVLVFFGGSDPDNYTERALKILIQTGRYKPEVVIGTQHPARENIVELLKEIPGSKLHVQTPYMNEILERVSWYLGAGGSITWERMYLGVSGLVISIAENQKNIVSELSRDGFHIETNLSDLGTCILELDWARLEGMNQKCWEYMGFGAVSE
jgi:UDP-2,4-diacetamido-2,4,6-trideoxy-beta-L-altropyranose hydrolase